MKSATGLASSTPSARAPAPAPHPGDFIKDTPTEAEPQFFCAPRDSCVGSPFPGDDPITNFMDYVDDVCMDNFTADQTKRMRKHWHAFRDKKARN